MSADDSISEEQSYSWGDGLPKIVGDFRKSDDSHYNVKYVHCRPDKALTERRLFSIECRPMERRAMDIWLNMPNETRPASPEDLIINDNSPGFIDLYVIYTWKLLDGSFERILEILKDEDYSHCMVQWKIFEKKLLENSY